MNIQQINHFLILSDILNYTHAAEKLNISQPGLYRSIEALQQELGVPLFVKTSGRGMSLSEAGEIFLPYAKSALAAIELAQKRLTDIGQHLIQEIRISVSIGYSLGSFKHVIDSFMENHKNIKFDIVQLQLLDSCEALKCQKIDFALSFLPDYIVNDELYSSIPLYNEEYSCFMHKNNPLAQKKSIVLSDLANQTILCYTEIGRKQYTKHLNELHIPHKVFPGICSKEMIFKIISQGGGICIAGNSSDYNTENIVRIPMRKGTLFSSHTLGLLWLKTRNFSGACAEFLEAVEQEKQRLNN